MEYAVLGMPAIAARTTAIEAYFDRSMIEFVEPGDLEDLVDRIRALRHDPERRRAMGRAMADFSVRHAWPIESARYVELVDRLARRRGVGSSSGQASAVVDGEARR
jgi:glycosyltransferase involved in cell wall biosynthesis